MKQSGTVFLLLCLAALSGGCRVCDTCYPFGGLMGRSGGNFEEDALEPREGSILDGPNGTTVPFEGGGLIVPDENGPPAEIPAE